MPTDMLWEVPDPSDITHCHSNTIPLLRLCQRRPTMSLPHRQGNTQHPQPWGIKILKELMDATDPGTQDRKGGHVSVIL